MTATFIAFFNNKGGVGKTSLVYHLAWMLAEKGFSVIAADLDPQANLTSHFLTEDDVEPLWAGQPEQHRTVYGSLAPLARGIGDIGRPPVVAVGDRLNLVPGDLALSGFEGELSTEWPRCLDGNERSFRVISSFWRLLTHAADIAAADVVLIDVGPNLGAINRAALIAADHVVIPLAPDLFSVQGLQNLGPTLRRWRAEWQQRSERNPSTELPLPRGEMRPAGYVLLQHGIRLGQPARAYQRWMDRIPGVYRTSVLDLPEEQLRFVDDPYCLGQIKHYRSLMPMSYEARKPVFALKPADGAFGGHQAAVAAARADFAGLAERVVDETGASMTDDAEVGQ
jgi:cellulose biosynthesis protein BcsQ